MASNRPTVFLFVMAATGLVLGQEAAEIGTKLADSTSAVGTSTAGAPTVAEADKSSGASNTESVPVVDTRQTPIPDSSNSISEAPAGEEITHLTPLTKGRALNLTFDDSISRLDDVTMEEEDDLHKEKKDTPITMLQAVTSDVPSPAMTTAPPTGGVEEFCVHGEERYKLGQSFDKGCLETCLCGQGGLIGCQPKCKAPFVPAGSNRDEACMERPSLESDACCVTLVCTSAAKGETLSTTTAAATTPASTTTESAKQTEAPKEEGCSYKDGHHKTGEQFNDGCEAVCYCEEAGHISCKPRCPPKVHNMTSDSCFAVPDPDDACCMKVLCDVSIQEHDVHKAGDIDMDDVELLSASILNSTSVQLETSQAISNYSVEVNADKEWKTASSVGATVAGLEPGTTYKLRIRHKGDISNEISVVLPAAQKSGACEFKGKTYARGEEFHDECRAVCSCGKTGVECDNIECNPDFVLHLIDPHCLEWETHPPGFTPTPPHCCPEKMVCKKNDGACTYDGQSFPNWTEIPPSVTGCENRCFCDSGNVTCSRVCPEVPKVPPPDLPCTAKEAALLNIPGDDCCVYWQCPDVTVNKTSEADPITTTPDSASHVMTPPVAPQKPDGYKDYHKSKPYGDSKNTFDKKDKEKEREKDREKEREKDKYHLKNSTKHDPNFLGPFNPNFYQQKNATKHDLIDDILSPFHLQDYAQEIKDHLKSNKTDEYEDYQDNNGGIEPEDPYLGNKKNIWGIGQKPGHPFKQSDIYYPGKQPPHDPLHELGPYQSNKLQGGHGRPDTPLVHPGIGGKHNQILQELGGGFPKGKPGSRPDSPLLSGDGGDALYPHQYLPSQDIYPPRLPSKYEEQDLAPHDKEIIHIHSDHPLRVQDILTHIQNKDRPHPGLTHPHYLDPAPHPHPYSPSAHLHQVEGLNKGFNGQHFSPGFPSRTQQHEPNEIKVHTLEALDETTVRLVFSVPAVFVGLHGRVELRYTSEKENNEPSSWEQQVLAPPGDLIATPELEFELGNLEPDTFYKIKISVVLRDIQNVPSSQVLTVKTPPAATSPTTLPPVIQIQADLRAVEVNSTWAKISWRKFTDFELQFIDGVQLRYKELDGKVYAATPLIHRAVTVYTLEDLRSDATYEVGIFFIPFPGQGTELQAHTTIHISTTIENDPYKFELALDVHHVKSTSVEVTWGGVPYPEDKYVNIFRILHQSEGGKEDFSQFKLAKRDLPATTLVTDLKPNTRYRLWLEAYLTNGRIKKSNVKDFVTKAGAVPIASTQQGKLEATPLVEAHDYYGPLVVVSILAALSIVSTLALLLVLARKHGHNKAPITAAVRKPPTQHSAAYDNPSYKTSDNDMEGGKRSNGVHIPMTIMQPSA